MVHGVPFIVVALGNVDPSTLHIYAALAAHFADGERRFRRIVSSCFARW
jgi:endonuclease V-like protein UPF0215 family